MGRRAHYELPEWLREASALSEFVRARKRTEEEWTIADRHHPVGGGGMACEVCGEQWPCPALRELAARWSDDPEYRSEWRDLGPREPDSTKAAPTVMVGAASLQVGQR